MQALEHNGNFARRYLYATSSTLVAGLDEFGYVYDDHTYLPIGFAPSAHAALSTAKEVAFEAGLELLPTQLSFPLALDLAKAVCHGEPFAGSPSKLPPVVRGTVLYLGTIGERLCRADYAPDIGFIHVSQCVINSNGAGRVVVNSPDGFMAVALREAWTAHSREDFIGVKNADFDYRRYRLFHDFIPEGHSLRS